MSSAPGAAASLSQPENLPLGARMAAVIRRPRTAFERIAEAPRPGPALALLFVVPFALFALLYSTEVGRRALVDQWERTAIAFGRTVDDATYAEFRRMSTQGIAYAAATSVARGPVLAVALAAALYGWFTAVRKKAASYRQVLGIVAYAGTILVLRDIVSVPLFYARESVGTATSLLQVAGGLDEGSPVARFLALIDVFVVWWLAVLAIGVSVVYGERPRGIGALLGGVYIAGALMLAGAMAALATV